MRLMRALKCDASKGELSLEDVSIPEVILPDDIVIKVGYAGLCGTDLHIMQGEFSVCGSSKVSGSFYHLKTKQIFLQVTLSHEFAGTIVSVGSGVHSRFRVGARVGVDPNRPCHCCQFCVRGESISLASHNLNINFSGQPHFCQDGGCRDASGVFRDGGAAEYCRVPAEQV